MGAISSIEWTDRTWNPVRGCSIVSPGCVNCYAMKQAHRFSGEGRAYHGLTKLTKAGPQWTGRIRCVDDALDEPLHWRKPARVFVNSMSDLFHEDVPETFIDRVFAVMALCPQHTFQVLTKRPERMRHWFDESSNGCSRLAHVAKAGYELGKRDNVWNWPLPNVWLGVSVENENFLWRIDHLKDVDASVRFVSFEPLLADVGALILDRIHWVIVGGESGPGARPFDLAWARSIVAQCKEAGVACFVKQLGAHVRGDVKGCLLDWRETPDGNWHRLPIIVAPGAQASVDEIRATTIGGRLYDKKGGDPFEWPEDLRVREFPEGPNA